MREKEVGMNCPEPSEFKKFWDEGSFPDERADQIADHVAECGMCRALWLEAGGIENIPKQIEEIEDQTEWEVRAKNQRILGLIFRILIWAAIVVFVAGITFVGLYGAAP